MDDSLKSMQFNRGLGALLSNMGGGGGNQERALPSHPTGGTDDWSATRNKRMAEPESMQKFSKKPREHTDEMQVPQEVNKWSDLQQYNDDHDSEFFKEENKRLAGVYGEGIVTVTYIENQTGKLGYYCELCFAVMNAKKSLDLHCSGMKHLKKKNIWEKTKGNPNGDGQGSSIDDLPDLPDGKKLKLGRNWKGDQDRSRGGGRGRGWDGDRGKDWDGDRGRGHGGDRGRGRDEDRGRGRYEDRGRGWEEERGYDRGDRDRRMSQYDDRYGRQNDRGYDDYNRSARDDRARFYADQDEYNRRGGSYSREEYPYTSMPYRDDRYSDRREYGEQYSSDSRASGQYRDGRYDTPGPYRTRSPPPPPTISNLSVAPAPPRITPLEGLSSGTTGSLLMKLATCSVKNDGDADLAANVIVLLVKGLKEYNHAISSSSSVHLLEDIAVKINVMKSLQKHEDAKPPASVGAYKPSSYSAPPYPRPRVKESIHTLRSLMSGSNM